MKYTVAVLVLCFAAFIYFFMQQDSDLVLRFYQSFGPEPCSVLRGKVVWITGASSGIGRQLAYDLAGCGCKLVLSARRKRKLEEVKKKCSDIALKQNPSFNKVDDIMVLPLDLGLYSSHTELSDFVIQKFGRVDALVNNGGISQMPVLFEKIPFDVEHKVLDTNLIGTISLTKTVLPHMLKRDHGQIVFVNSVFGIYATPGFGAYCASKFGLKGYADTLRYEVSSRNITIVNTYPGPVVSDISLNALTDNVNKTVANSPHFQEYSDKFKDFQSIMATERFTYLMTVAMANNIEDSWMAPRDWLNLVYMSHYFNIGLHVHVRR